MLSCDLCGMKVQYGPHRYDLHKWYNYDIFVCRMCHVANEDGIGPLFEPKFESILKEKGIDLPIRNKKGWYPIGSSF
jgi:hypothetical protein